MAGNRNFCIIISLTIGVVSLFHRVQAVDLSSADDSHPVKTVEDVLKHYQSKLYRKLRSVEPSVWIGVAPPNDADRNPLKGNWFSPKHRTIRSRNEVLSEEICKTNRYWKQINATRDIYGQEVRIAHTEEYRQFAFVYECVGEGERCKGIEGQLQSACEMRTGWANMLHFKIATGVGNTQDEEAVWGYVAVPHHCACRIYPKVNPFL